MFLSFKSLLASLEKEEYSWFFANAEHSESREELSARKNLRGNEEDRGFFRKRVQKLQHRWKVWSLIA